MTPRILVLAAAATLAMTSQAVLAQSSPTPAAPAVKDVDPVGSYQLSIAVQGSAMGAVAKIEKAADGTLGGTVSTDAYGSFAINSVKVSGKAVTLSITTSDGSPVTISLTIDGDQVTGEWSMSNDGSKVTGKKLP